MLKSISNMTSLDNYSLLWIIVGFITFSYLIISKTRAPYGRHSKNGWGPMISNSWGWFWMELPALVVMPIVSIYNCLLYTSPSPRDQRGSRMPSSA